MIFNLNGTPFKFHLLVVLHVLPVICVLLVRPVLRVLQVVLVLSVVTRPLFEPMLDRTHPLFELKQNTQNIEKNPENIYQFNCTERISLS
jgi:hypothetical protein